MEAWGGGGGGSGGGTRAESQDRTHNPQILKGKVSERGTEETNLVLWLPV